MLVMRLLPFTRVSEAKIIINLSLLPKLLAQRKIKDVILKLLRFICITARHY